MCVLWRRSCPLAVLGALVVVTVFAASAVPAFTADNGSVAATVTVATPCITIDGLTSIDFGVKSFSTPGAPEAFSVVDSYTNCSSAGENVSARGTNATSGGSPPVTWTLTPNNNPCDAGANQFAMSIAKGGTFFLNASSDTQVETLGSGVASTVGLQLHMPCSGSAGTGQQMSFEYIFTATF